MYRSIVINNNVRTNTNRKDKVALYPTLRRTSVVELTTNRKPTIRKQIYFMAQEVIIVANPQGVDAITIGCVGTIVKQFKRFALIEFENEFGEKEQWYFSNSEFIKK